MARFGVGHAVGAFDRGVADGHTVTVAPHTDEIGMVVKRVRADGFARFEKVGGARGWPRQPRQVPKNAGSPRSSASSAYR